MIYFDVLCFLIYWMMVKSLYFVRNFSGFVLFGEFYSYDMGNSSVIYRWNGSFLIQLLNYSFC